MFISPYFRRKDSEKALLFTGSADICYTFDMDKSKADYIASAFAAFPAGTGDVHSITFYMEPVSDRRLGISAEAVGGHKEEYAVIFGRDTSVISPTENGLLLGFAALMMAVDAGETQPGVLYNWPKYAMRGYRAFIPGPQNIDSFKAVVDKMAYYQHNTLFLEVGGAMEYKRHPEINEKWVEYAADMHKYSGRSHEIQKQTYRWAKNSIHADNGDGLFLTQEQVRELIAYCRARGIDVIPEVPTLSHCDYLVMAHPEIREREGDAYPDTYCPNHPDTYKLVFDILDEVAEVFQSGIIHIGHDECYSIGICPRCQDTLPEDIYTADITRIHDYLAGKGIKAMMWSEKLLTMYPNSYFTEPYGGLERWKTYPDGERVQICQKLYPCRDKLPRDIIMMHWYGIFGVETDDVYHSRGYGMVYGNASIIQLEEWNRRAPKSLGAIASNWGSYAPEYMQRNLQNFDLVYNARALAGHDYDGSTDQRTRFVNETIDELFRSAHKDKTDYIEAVHTTDKNIPYEIFYDGIFIEDEKYLLGEYELTFDDGTTARLPVKYGTHISCMNSDAKCVTIGESITQQDSSLVESASYREVAGVSRPVISDGKILYQCRYANPRPGHDVVSFVYVPIQKDAHIVVDSLKRIRKG